MNKGPWTGVVLGIALLPAGCAEKEQAMVAAPIESPVRAGEAEAKAGADNWEPGKDLAGTQVVVGGVSQEVPDDVAATKRKFDAVGADYEARMDALERERQKKFAEDKDFRP